MQAPEGAPAEAGAAATATAALQHAADVPLPDGQILMQQGLPQEMPVSQDGLQAALGAELDAAIAKPEYQPFQLPQQGQVPAAACIYLLSLHTGGLDFVRL